MGRKRKAVAVWITGIPGSGKSTVAQGFKKRHPGFVVLRMDELRKVATPRPTYSEAEREILYRGLVYMAECLCLLGHDVLIDATGNLRRWRELARARIKPFAEVYLRCPLPVAIERERSRKRPHAAPRGIYGKAAHGWPVPGVSAPYQKPLRPELAIDTDKTSPDEAVKMLEGLVRKLRAP